MYQTQCLLLNEPSSLKIWLFLNSSISFIYTVISSDISVGIWRAVSMTSSREESTRFWACRNGSHFKIKKSWVYHIIPFETLCLDSVEKNGSSDKKDCTLLRTRNIKFTLIFLIFIASTILRHQQTILASSFRCLELGKLT